MTIAEQELLDRDIDTAPQHEELRRLVVTSRQGVIEFAAVLRVKDEWLPLLYEWADDYPGRGISTEDIEGDGEIPFLIRCYNGDQPEEMFTWLTENWEELSSMPYAEREREISMVRDRLAFPEQVF